MIYEEAFAEDFRYCDSDGSGSRVYFEWKFQFARCNKQIHNEALPLLYKIHIFQFKVWKIGRPVSWGIYDLGGIHLRFKEAPQGMLAMITDMHICLDEACVEEDAANGSTVTIQFFGQISRACTSLRTLHIQTHELARPMYLMRMDHGFEYESPPYRRAMVKVLQALARRLQCLEFQVTDHIWAFEEFLSQIAPLECWDKSSTPGTKGWWGASHGDQIYKLRGPFMLDDGDDTVSHEALTCNEGIGAGNEESTGDGEEGMIGSNVENSDNDVRGPATIDENSDPGAKSVESHEDLEAEASICRTSDKDLNSMDKQMPAAPRGNGLRWPTDPAKELQAMTIDYFSRSVYIRS
ncbi:MAG: hypothetical protein OHK93_004675 [Ramalina farinacea]|uniref:Uncharacterized protein n=1 Tax=Ramalina farinacea TaxID=258253 RepID=A0AA43QV71_9LECA|nr:hypothetical protein [Ramalina farinacea]